MLFDDLPALVGKVVCCDIFKFNNTDILATLGNFSSRWTVGVDDIKNENDTKKIHSKKIFY